MLQAPAQLAGEEHYGAAEKQIRKSQDLEAHVSDRQMLKSRLEQASATLFQHFQIQASRQEQAQFLRYLPGDYFKAHRDWADQDIYRDRVLSLVLFLNDHSEPEGFKGGRFSFLLPHPLHPADSQRLLGVPIYPQTGLLIAFRPQLLHEVSPVTAGQRYTVVTWLSR